MKLLYPFITELTCTFQIDGKWEEIPCVKESGELILFRLQDGSISISLTPVSFGWSFVMEAKTSFATQVRLAVTMEGELDAYHVIPCNIYGDNNIDRVKPGEFPSLTRKYKGTRFCSPFWEFRADRAAVPVSMMCNGGKTVGISICPYSQEEEKQKNIHNGVFAALPGTAGVSMGYENLPATFVDKGNAGEITGESVQNAKAEGLIYLLEGKERMAMHDIVRMEYTKLHSRAEYKKSLQEAGAAIIRSCIDLNWNDEWQAYTDMSCCPPQKPDLKAWRPVYEIGWTGIAELACPFIMGEKLLGLPENYFEKARNGWELFDQIADAFHEESGLLNDLVAPVDESGSLVNGWWIWYHIAEDCHCAYNNGKAVHEMLKTAEFLHNRGEAYPEHWLSVCLKVLDTIIALQREDGNYGYTYSHNEKKVLDWDGFAGCWFLPCMVYAYRLTGEEKYLDSARKAETFYSKYVLDLNCYGTPMDTWKAVDEEGNLAFVRGTRLLYETTGEKKYLEHLEAGACYEYLWRYGYASRPENDPLKDGWNSCGGSITSISNPHIHPMGVIIDGDLRYLAAATGDEYHRMRADDSTAWMMQNLELYPEKSGYGQYGITSERFCPSDGLVTERYSDGHPYSSWFSFNLWATANVLEAIMDLLAEEEKE